MSKNKKSFLVKHYFASIILYGFITFLYLDLKIFNNFFNHKIGVFSVKNTMILIFLLFLIINPIYLYFVSKKFKITSRPLIIFNYFKNFILKLFELKLLNVNKTEKKNFLIIFVKAFFFPQMLTFVFGNLFLVKKFFNNILIYYKNPFISYNFIKIDDLFKIFDKQVSLFLLCFVSMLYFIDTAFFLIGYLLESKLLKNQIKSVESSIDGIFFCIICYYPFVIFLNHLFPIRSDVYTLLQKIYSLNIYFLFLLKLISVFFVTIYASATVALGFKSSNLTNRGIVSKFPYSIVRHPAYISKNIAWLLAVLPLLIVTNSIKIRAYGIISFIFFLVIYYLRALTEEKHLSKDPDYLKYKKKVRWMFIPNII